MFGVIVNAVAIIIGSFIGILVGKKLSDKITKAVIIATGLATLYIGIKGALVGENSIILILSLVLGTLVGTIIDLDKYISLLGEFLKRKFVKGSSSSEKFVDAFVTTSVLFGIGAMAIMGSIEAGINHKYDIFFVKSTLDFISAIIYSASLGIGVMFSAFTIFVLQGAMTLLASVLKPIASNQHVINEISCVGNVLIIAISLNILGLTKIKIANLLPAVIFAPILYYLIAFVGISL